ncbi:MAG: HesA/MoeB/ThiF family protein [Bacteroidetes bacterium]|nr:HesA/MoeB/ThiF family protein [Bacteroidota bacterium]
MDFEKYQRQISHPKVGVNGQQHLQAAKVLVVGAGGLGCPILQYLAAAGVGMLGIVDGDVVTKSNLPRQILFSEFHLGKLKTECAAEKLIEMNPSISISTFPTYLNNKNAVEIIRNWDVIVDATDDFATRYLLNDACVLLEKPIVYGAIFSEEGQVAVFNLKIGNDYSSNYRDLFPQPPAKGEVPTCVELGVIGVLPGTIGLLQANEVIKIITKSENNLSNKLLVFNLSTYDSTIFDVEKNDALKIPSTQNESENFDYNLFCGSIEKVSENNFS